jgi:ABC-type bacteriocin/lantibiotic exporter with double-glycine peptidase domain
MTRTIMKTSITKILLFLLSCSFIISCAGVKVDSNDSNAHLIRNVKQIYQGPMQCSAASLTMILQYYNVDASLDKIDSEIRPGGGGVGCLTLEEYAASNGFRSESFTTSDPGKLKQYISKDIPLIALVYSEMSSRCHNVVIVGYTSKGLIVNDPWGGRRFKSYEAFKKWGSCNFFGCGPYWTLAIYR